MTDTAVIYSIIGRDQASPVFGKIAKAAGAMAAGLVGIAAIGFMKDSVAAASDLNESLSKAQVVFGKSDAAVLAFAAHSASALGMSRQEAIEATATFGNFFEAMGVAQPKAAGM